jgi:peptide/nickel transport system ATP-binding protein
MYLGLIVEVGATGEIWKQPKHPYTQALIGAVPRADGLGTKPKTLPGEVPNPANPPAGCRFHPRCPQAFDRCSVETPPLLTLDGGRTVACWLHTGEAATDDHESPDT